MHGDAGSLLAKTWRVTQRDVHDGWVTARPASITTACLLWIVYGGLAILGGVLTLQASEGRRWVVVVLAFGGFQIVFGAAFLITGIQVLLGKASSVFASGIVCLILGALALLGGLASGGVFASSLAAMIILGSAGLLIAAGSLAIVGNDAYKQWIATR